MAKEPVLCDRCGDPLKYGHVCKATIRMDHLHALLDAFQALQDRHDTQTCTTAQRDGSACRTCEIIRKVHSFA